MISPKIVQLKKNEKLSLTNDGTLSLFWVGVGAAFSKKFFQTNLLIIKGNHHLLIDCGTRCPVAFWEYGCSITNVENYLITHSHADHIGGLEEVALMNRYVTKKKPKMIITKEYEKILWDYSLKGGSAFNEGQKNDRLQFSDFFESTRPKKISDKPRVILETCIGDINLKLFRTKHIPDNAKTWKDSFLSYGVIINDKILFTSDTRYDKDLIYKFLEEFKQIQYIFHDCQLFSGGVHASYNELLNFQNYLS